jgi:hypothetical protein
MPNINLLPTLPVATSSTYVIASENGFAKRINFEDLSSSVAGTVVGDNRTDQPLFTTSSARFNSVTLVDNSIPYTGTTSLHSFTTFTRSKTGDNIKLYESIGALRFSGYDGINNYDSNNFVPSFAFTAFSTEDFSGTSGKTTNAGTGWKIESQPNGVELTPSSRQALLLLAFPAGPTIAENGEIVPPISNLYIGSGIDRSIPELKTSSGASMQPGYGKTNIIFTNATTYHRGVTSSDPSPLNNSLTGTNYISIQSSRNSAEQGYRKAIKSGDRLGGLVFAGTHLDETTSTFGNPVVITAGITATALEDFSTGTHRSSLAIYTADANTTTTVARFEASDVANKYNSAEHVFYTGQLTTSSIALTVDSTKTSVFNSSLEVTTSTVAISNGQFVFHSTGTLVFPDNTVQVTGYPGYTGTRAVPVPANSSSSGLPGDIAYDSTHVYICVAANTWRRMNATAF